MPGFTAETGSYLEHYSPLPYRLTVAGDVRAAFSTATAAADALQALDYDDRITAAVTFSFDAL